MRERRPRAPSRRRAVAVAVVAAASAVLAVTGVPRAVASFVTGATATATWTADTLAPPGDLTSGSCLLGSVTLEWTATPSSWADGYEVRWGTTPGGPYPNATTVATTSAVVTGLSLLTTHYFVVRAYDGGWRSAFTAQRAVSC